MVLEPPTSLRFAKAIKKLAASNLAKLPKNTHLSGGIFANTNWLDAVFKFPPTPIPINPRNETIESGSNRFWSAVLQPDTESRRMFTFIDTGRRSAHSFVLWANPALTFHAVLPIGRNWASNHLAKIQLKLANRVSAVGAIQLPDMRNVMHTCARPVFWVLVRQAGL
jgi:hypothetical protein